MPNALRTMHCNVSPQVSEALRKPNGNFTQPNRRTGDHHSQVNDRVISLRRYIRLLETLLRIIDASFDARTRALLNSVLDDAWSKVHAAPSRASFDALVLRANLAIRLLAAANEGERDRARLKSAALRQLPMIKRERF
jgi:hypothetical protein